MKPTFANIEKILQDAFGISGLTDKLDTQLKSMCTDDDKKVIDNWYNKLNDGMKIRNAISHDGTVSCKISKDLPVFFSKLTQLILSAITVIVENSDCFRKPS